MTRIDDTLFITDRSIGAEYQYAPNQVGIVLAARTRNMRMSGLIAESFPLAGIAGSITLTTQIVYGAGLYLLRGEVITGVAFVTAVAGTSTAPAGFKVGLWSSAATPVVLALSADAAADACLTTAGPMLLPFTTPYTVPADGTYYPSAWENGAFAGTALKLSGVTGVVGQQGLGGAGAAAALPNRFTTALKTTATLAVLDTGTYANSGGVWPWLAVY